MTTPDDARAPRILVTNDDGIDSAGIGLLTDAARTLSGDVWVVAPESDQSGTSHSVSLHQPLRARRVDDHRFAVAGTPSDCVLLGAEHLIEGRRPDLVLAGINRGANISDSIVFSGTVGAAVTASVLGIPSVALSQSYRDPDHVRWDTSAALAAPLLRALLGRAWPGTMCLNVNLPDLAAEAVRGVAVCRPARGTISGVRVEARDDTRGLPYYWIAFARNPRAAGGKDGDTDVAALREGRVAVTPLHPTGTADGDWEGMADALSDALGNGETEGRAR